MGFFETPQGAQARWALVIALWFLVAFLAVEVVSGIASLRYIGTGVAAANTLSVTGHGEVFAAPDIAEFSFTVSSDQTTVASAQSDATTKINAVTSYLTAQGVSKDDIQTTDYSIEPQYENQAIACPIQPLNGGAVSSGVYCPPSKQVLTGYEVSQTDTVKVRNTSNAGALLTGVGSNGATQVSGLNFTFDNPETTQNEARQMAISDAQAKAQTLAKQLGVTLVRVTSFQENTNGISPQPIAYAMAANGATAASTPDISTGQNDVTDDVTITYEIK